MTKSQSDEGPDYWSVVSEGIEIEDKRLSLYLKHKHSRGVAREAILRRVLAENIVEPYRAKTGFIAAARELVASDQCDILIYDPRSGQPLYRIDEFVVVGREAARLAIEVRSRLSVHGKGKSVSGLDQIFKVWESIRHTFAVPVFGYGFEGPSFSTFVAAVARRVQGDIERVPECIAVLRPGYILVRVRHTTNPMPPPRTKGCCVVIDFSKQRKQVRNFATSYFLHLIAKRLPTPGEATYDPYFAEFIAMHVRDWRLDAGAANVIWADGVVTEGYGGLGIDNVPAGRRIDVG